MLKQDLENQVEDLKIKLDTYKGLTHGLREVVKEKDKKLSIANDKREEYYNLYCEEIKKLKNSKACYNNVLDNRDECFDDYSDELERNNVLSKRNNMLTYLFAIACGLSAVFIYLYTIK